MHLLVRHRSLRYLTVMTYDIRVLTCSKLELRLGCRSNIQHCHGIMMSCQCQWPWPWHTMSYALRVIPGRVVCDVVCHGFEPHIVPVGSLHHLVCDIAYDIAYDVSFVSNSASGFRMVCPDQRFICRWFLFRLLSPCQCSYSNQIIWNLALLWYHSFAMIS